MFTPMTMQMSSIKLLMVLVSSGVLATLLYISSHNSTTIPVRTEVVRFLYNSRLREQIEAHHNTPQIVSIIATSLLGDVSYNKLVEEKPSKNRSENQSETTVTPVLGTQDGTTIKSPLQR